MLYQGYIVPPTYDSLIAKVMVYGKNREEAIQKMLRVIGELIIEGIDTNIDYLYDLMMEEEFQKSQITTDFVEKVLNRK